MPMTEGKTHRKYLQQIQAPLSLSPSLGCHWNSRTAMEELMQRLEGPRCLFLEDTCGNALEVMSLRGTECWSGVGSGGCR